MQNVTRTFQFKHSLLIVVQVAALSLIWFSPIGWSISFTCRYPPI